MVSSSSVDGADGVGEVVRMIVRESDVGADLDSGLADNDWAMIRRWFLVKGKAPLPYACHTRVFRCVSTFPETNSGKIRIGSRHCS